MATGDAVPDRRQLARLIDEYVLAMAPVLMGGGTPFYAALHNWVNPNPVETRTFPTACSRLGMTDRQALNADLGSAPPRPQ